MKLNKFLKLSLGILFALPTSIFFGNEMLANQLAEKIDYEIQNDNLLACAAAAAAAAAAAPHLQRGKQKKQKKQKQN